MFQNKLMQLFYNWQNYGGFAVTEYASSGAFLLSYEPKIQ